jgi:hypothetical protein
MLIGPLCEAQEPSNAIRDLSSDLRKSLRNYLYIPRLAND